MVGNSERLASWVSLIAMSVAFLVLVIYLGIFPSLTNVDNKVRYGNETVWNYLPLSKSSSIATSTVYGALSEIGNYFSTMGPVESHSFAQTTHAPRNSMVIRTISVAAKPFRAVVQLMVRGISAVDRSVKSAFQFLRRVGAGSKSSSSQQLQTTTSTTTNGRSKSGASLSNVETSTDLRQISGGQIKKNKKSKQATKAQGNEINSQTATTSSIGHNDHLESDLRKLGIPREREQVAREAHQALLSRDDFPVIQQAAEDTHLFLSPHFAYRFYSSTDWTDLYMNKRVEDCMAETALWRQMFGIERINTTSFAHLVRSGFAYTSPRPDKAGRPIIYFKIGRISKPEDRDLLLQLLLYTVERADKQAVKYRSGQFVAIIDLADFSWSRSPPIGMIKEAVVLLRRHYPYRLGGVFIVNAGSAFNFLWNLVTPLLSKKAIGKTFVLGKHEMVGILDEKIGKEHIEVAYGGALTVQFPIEVLPIAGLADAADTTASASTTRAPSPAGSGALGLQYVEHVKTSRRRQQAVLVAMDGSAEGTVATATATAATLTTSTDANPEKDVVQHEQMMRHHLEQQRLLHVEEQAARAVQEYFDQGYWANPPRQWTRALH